MTRLTLAFEVDGRVKLINVSILHVSFTLLSQFPEYKKGHIRMCILSIRYVPKHALYEGLEFTKINLLHKMCELQSSNASQFVLGQKMHKLAITAPQMLPCITSPTPQYFLQYCQKYHRPEDMSEKLPLSFVMM